MCSKLRAEACFFVMFLLFRNSKWYEDYSIMIEQESAEYFASMLDVVLFNFELSLVGASILDPDFIWEWLVTLNALP